MRGLVNGIHVTGELIIVFSWWLHCWILVCCIIYYMLAENNITSLFPSCGPGLATEKEGETLLYFKNEWKLLGPICPWSHSENTALCLLEQHQDLLHWCAGNDECQAKNGNLSLWVSSHPPTSFPLSSGFSCTFTHISSQVNWRQFAREMKELGKNAQSERFFPFQKTVLPVSDRKAPCQELISISYLQK